MTAGTTSTLLNPDKLTLTTYISASSDMSEVKVEPIFAESVIMEPVNDVRPYATCLCL